MTGAYQSWSSIASALKSAASKNARAGGLDVSTQLTLARFDRLLCRVFADGEASPWLLKGGTSILSRVQQSRSTKDVDLSSSQNNLNAAETALRECASRDLGDGIRFDLTSSRQTGKGDNQPDVHTRRLIFTCYDTATGRRVGDVPVDLVTGHSPVGTVETADPTYRLTLGKPLTAYPYRLYPIADQIADKVCATMTGNYPGGQPSSRVKDLVDLVVVARTQTVDLSELRLAIETKRTLAQLDRFDEFTIPAGWEKTYARLARSTPAAGDVTSSHAAQALVAELINPALTQPPAAEAAAIWSPRNGWTGPDHLAE